MIKTEQDAYDIFKSKKPYETTSSGVTQAQVEEADLSADEKFTSDEEEIKVEDKKNQ